MKVRVVQPSDAAAIAAIYGPVVANTSISFELDPPSVDDMRARIVATLTVLPWLVCEDDAGVVAGYAYAGRHRERPAYQWSADVTAYVRADCHRQGVGRALYAQLLPTLAGLGYRQAFAGIALPNAASVGLHEAVCFVPIGVYREVGFKHGAWRDVGWWQRQLGSSSAPDVPRLFESGSWRS